MKIRDRKEGPGREAKVRLSVYLIILFQSEDHCSPSTETDAEGGLSTCEFGFNLRTVRPRVILETFKCVIVSLGISVR